MNKEQEVRILVEQLDIKTGSTYDFNNHIPYPTIDKIDNSIGINLTLLEGSESRARAKVRLFTSKAFRILVFNKVDKTRRDLEYLIATNLDYRRDFITYVINLIGDVFISGNNSILMSSESETSENLRQRARLYHSGSLDANRYDMVYYEYRVGY